MELFLFNFFRVYHFHIYKLLYPLQNCVMHLKKNYFFCHYNFMKKKVILSCRKINLVQKNCEKLSNKGFSGLKQKMWTLYTFYIILHIEISLVRNFSSNWQFWWPTLPKKVFLVENRKIEHHLGIRHIWISLATIFQLKLIILSFWTKYT